MAAIPAILWLTGMIWLAVRDKGEVKGSSEASQEGLPDHVISDAVYSIDGYEYAVYEILDPEGNKKTTFSGSEKRYFIAANPSISDVLQTAAGYATYDTLKQAKSALDSMYASTVAPDAPQGPEPPSTPSEPTPAPIDPEGLEEGGMMREIDVEIYEGGSVVDSYSIDQTATVRSGTDLTGAI